MSAYPSTPASEPRREGAAANGTALRPATPADLKAINGVVERAVMSWDLPERVKRLSLPAYRYHAHDLDVMGFLVAEDTGVVVGVAAWEPAAASSLPPGRTGLLLHGLYVAPRRQGRGIGAALLAAVEGRAAAAGLDGVLVKAQRGAAGFFVAQGMTALAPAAEAAGAYPHRYWKPVPAPA